MDYAHSLPDEPDRGKWHKLEDHLAATAKLAGEFARPFLGGLISRLKGEL